MDENASCLFFESSDRDVQIRIFEGEEHSSEGFEKYDGAILVYDHVTERQNGDKFYLYSLGEYVLIDGHKYWIDVSNGDIKNKNSDNVSDVMNYLNSHNSWEYVSSNIP